MLRKNISGRIISNLQKIKKFIRVLRIQLKKGFKVREMEYYHVR